MPKQIIWSPLSENDFVSILDYLKANWDDRVVQGFIDITTSTLLQISTNPKQFPLIYKNRKIRKCVLTKHNTLFYRDTKDSIDILRIFDNRQDPEKTNVLTTPGI
jgi:plasmid stabilization system protein ParE